MAIPGQMCPKKKNRDKDKKDYLQSRILNFCLCGNPDDAMIYVKDFYDKYFNFQRVRSACRNLFGAGRNGNSQKYKRQKLAEYGRLLG